MAPLTLRLPLLIWFILIVLVGVEIILQGADLRIWGSARWRTLAYQNGAFWPGLLDNWRPNYPVQPATMFFSYALLHGGLGHLAGNAITLGSIGPSVIDQVGRRGFIEIFAASALGGALLYAWLNASPQPMVGASGAIFGLAGALVAWLWKDGAGWPRLITILAFLILLNVVVWWSLDGLLAWESHLGGFLAGALVGLFLPRQPGRSDHVE